VAICQRKTRFKGAEMSILLSRMKYNPEQEIDPELKKSETTAILVDF